MRDRVKKMAKEMLGAEHYDEYDVAVKIHLAILDSDNVLLPISYIEDLVLEVSKPRMSPEVAHGLHRAWVIRD